MPNSTCPMPKEAFEYNDKGSAHHVMVLITFACLIFTAISSLALIMFHLRRYRCPKEQRQIIRIVFLTIVYSSVCFGQVLDYGVAQFAAPSGSHDDDHFQAVREAEEHHTGFDWPRITWIFVFQFPLTAVLSAIITIGTAAAGTYCSQSLSPKYGNLWASVISSVGVGAAVIAIYRFYGHVKKTLKARRGLSKLVAIKIIVFISFIQDWIFSILLEKNALKPDSTLSYDDLMWGIPALVLSCEMVLFSAFFWYAYSSNEYSCEAKPKEQRLPIYRAVLDALNPMDFILGIGTMFTLILHLQRTGGFKQWSSAKAETKAQRKVEGKRGGLIGMLVRVIGGIINKLRGRRSPPPQKLDGYVEDQYRNAQKVNQAPTRPPPAYKQHERWSIAESSPA